MYRQQISPIFEFNLLFIMPSAILLDALKCKSTGWGDQSGIGRPKMANEIKDDKELQNYASCVNDTFSDCLHWKKGPRDLGLGKGKDLG